MDSSQGAGSLEFGLICRNDFGQEEVCLCLENFPERMDILFVRCFETVAVLWFVQTSCQHF